MPNNSDNSSSYLPDLLRLICAGLYLWFAFSTLKNPQYFIHWSSLDLARYSAKPEQLVLLASGLVTALSSFLALGLYTRVMALSLLLVTLGFALISQNTLETILLWLTIIILGSISFSGPGRFTFDRASQQQ